MQNIKIAKGSESANKKKRRKIPRLQTNNNMHRNILKIHQIVIRTVKFPIYVIVNTMTNNLKMSLLIFTRMKLFEELMTSSLFGE